ncbi:MAG: ATP synthase F0 subunit B [Faecalibacterium prausnitzii]
MELYQALITLDGWTFLAQICNLMIQLVIFKKFLLKPIKQVIADRKAKADSEIADAQKLRTEAEAMKAEYEQNLQNARTEANQIVAAAQKTATARSEEIVGEARAQSRCAQAEGRGRHCAGAQEGCERGQGRDRRHCHGDRIQGGGARDQ